MNVQSAVAPVSSQQVAAEKRRAFDEEARTKCLDLSIICVNWNSIEYLIECITSIYGNPPGVPFEIIVVDNASPDGGLERISDQFPQVTIVKSATNLGFAGANNMGFRRSTGRSILFLNPDTRIIGSAIDLMYEQLWSIPDAGIVGCTLLNTDLTVSTSSIQKFPTILNQLLTTEFLRLRFPGLPLWSIAPLFAEREAPLKVDVIPGACMMLKRAVFEQAGLLTEDYFMYAEDIDLNYKVSKLGLASYYAGKARIIHHGGRSSSRQKISQWSTIMVQRSMVKFFRKSHGHLYSLMYRGAMGCAAVLRLAILALMFPFGDRQGIRWAMEKWSTVLNWAVGFERMEA